MCVCVCVCVCLCVCVFVCVCVYTHTQSTGTVFEMFWSRRIRALDKRPLRNLRKKHPPTTHTHDKKTRNRLPKQHTQHPMANQHPSPRPLNASPPHPSPPPLDPSTPKHGVSEFEERGKALEAIHVIRRIHHPTRLKCPTRHNPPHLFRV